MPETKLITNTPGTTVILVQMVRLCVGHCVSLSVGGAVVVLLEIFKHSQTITTPLSTGTRAGQHHECCTEDSVENVARIIK